MGQIGEQAMRSAGGMGAGTLARLINDAKTAARIMR